MPRKPQAPDPKPPTSPARFRLTCNVRLDTGHTLQVGEAFSRDEAERLGILDRCKPIQQGA